MNKKGIILVTALMAIAGLMVATDPMWTAPKVEFPPTVNQQTVAQSVQSLKASAIRADDGFMLFNNNDEDWNGLRVKIGGYINGYHYSTNETVKAKGFIAISYRNCVTLDGERFDYRKYDVGNIRLHVNGYEMAVLSK